MSILDDDPTVNIEIELEDLNKLFEMNPSVENLKAMKNKTKVVPSKMEKQIEENQVKYGKRIKQLSHIIIQEILT